MLFCFPVESNCLAGCIFVIADYPDRMEHAILNTWIEVKWFLHVCYFQRRKFNVNTRLSIQGSVLFINRMLIHVALRSWTLHVSLYTLKQWEAKFLIKDSTRPWQRFMYVDVHNYEKWISKVVLWFLDLYRWYNNMGAKLAISIQNNQHICFVSISMEIFIKR